MNSHVALDRAAMVLGGVSSVSSVFVFLDGGNFQLVQIRAAGLVVALVLGVLAVVAGWFQEATLHTYSRRGGRFPARGSRAAGVAGRRQWRFSRRQRIGVLVVAGVGCWADGDWRSATTGNESRDIPRVD
jgi:hypothetical protein